MEKTKVRIKDYLPIRLGWLKVLPVLAAAIIYLAFITWWPIHHWNKFSERDIPSLKAFLGLSTGYFVFAILNGTFKKLSGLAYNYLRLNVWGQVANFEIGKDGELNFWISGKLPDCSALAGVNILWRVPLGGWIKKRPQLFRAIGGYWQEAGWNFGLINIYGPWGIITPSQTRVLLKDWNGNRLEGNLASALKFVAKNRSQGLELVFDTHVTMQATLAERDRWIGSKISKIFSVISEAPTKYPRFFNSKGGQELLLQLQKALIL